MNHICTIQSKWGERTLKQEMPAELSWFLFCRCKVSPRSEVRKQSAGTVWTTASQLQTLDVSIKNDTVKASGRASAESSKRF